MTQESTLRRAAALPPADLWVIGQYETVDGRVDYPLSEADLARDTAWMAGLLGAHGLAPGDRAVVVSAGWESPWTGPVMAAVRACRAAVCFAEIWGWDVARVDMFVRRLAPRLVIGLNAEVAGALETMGGLEDRLGPTTVLARPDAHARLAAGGLAPVLLDYVGPMTALECPVRDGAHVNGDEWAVSAVGGGLEVRTVGPRAHRPPPVRLAVDAVVDDRPCDCGMPGPRLHLAAAAAAGVA